MKNNHAIVANLVRQDLKTLFPDTKFSVTGSKFAGGDQVTIKWTPGPSYDEIVNATKKYERGSEQSPTVRYISCNII